MELNNRLCEPPASIRVLVVGAPPAPDTFEWHIMDALGHLGVPARLVKGRFTFRAAPALTGAITKFCNTLMREPERLIEKRLLHAAHEFAPTLILVIQGNQLSPKSVTRLRAITSAPIACWCQDQMTALGRQFVLGAGYDAVFLKDRYMQDLFSRMIGSTTFHYLPEACNPRVHRSVELKPADHERYDCEVMIAGTLYYYRQEILQQLSGVNLRVWGIRPDWLLYRLRAQHINREIVMEAKAKAMAGARICLNTLHFAEINGLNCRAFEIAGCGGFQLVSQVPVIAEHFEPDVELVTFDSAPDLIDKVHHFLRNPQQAVQIARRGQLRAHRDHTYEKRLSEILRICTGSPP